MGFFYGVVAGAARQDALIGKAISPGVRSRGGWLGLSIVFAGRRWRWYAPPALSYVWMVDIPLLPAQTDAAALDQLEVAVRKRLDQFLQSGCIWLVQQMGPA